MARGQNKSGDDKYTPKKDDTTLPKPGTVAPRSGQYVVPRGHERTIPRSGNVKVSTSNGKYGGPPRGDNWADKIIEKVFGDKG
jgi:hypothetical protein